MCKHVALAVLRYTECSKVNDHYRTRVYQTQIVHFIKKLSETCSYSIKACNYVDNSKWPPSWRECLPTYRHESTYGSYSDHDGGESYRAVCDNVHLK